MCELPGQWPIRPDMRALSAASETPTARQLTELVEPTERRAHPSPGRRSRPYEGGTYASRGGPIDWPRIPPLGSVSRRERGAGAETLNSALASGISDSRVQDCSPTVTWRA